MSPRSVFLALVSLASLSAQTPAPLPFVQKNCIACHNATLASGDVNFAAHTAAETFTTDRALWERVAAKLKAGEMPPPGIPKPPAGDIDVVTKWLSGEFARQDRAIQPDAGRVTARRLNRAEYDNTIRDLLGVDLHLADNFPQDGAAFGFDNIGDALNISPALMEKFVNAADQAVRAAIFGPPALKPSYTHYPSTVRIPVMPKPIGDYDLTGLSSPSSTHAMHRFPVAGEYSFRLVLNGHRPNQSEPAHVAFWIDCQLMHEFEVDATDLEGQIREFRTKVTAGDHLLSATYLKQYHGLPPSYNGPEPSKRPPVPLITMRGQLSEKDLETLRKLGTTIKLDRVETRVDNRFEALDVGGPFEEPVANAPVRAASALVSTPPTRKLIFVCEQRIPACARQIVTAFTRRAFRRSVTSQEVEPFVNLVAFVQKHGDSFDEGVATALEAVLVSPQFLFRIERDRPAAPGKTSLPVSDYELASRLSYFLWSSMPDDELLRVAGTNQLRQPAVLTAQVRRMLKDPKSQALVENFGGQWLQFKNIDVERPDTERFPDWDEYLRYSMRRETELFFENIVRNDGSLLEFLDAPYTFVNERLARFYGIPGVTGPEFRKVDVSGTARGGGLLAQASILTISSYATRTSPVLRGKWVLENLLNTPPPPPPPNVPALDDTKIGQSLSMRQQLEEHRKNAICAGCHSRMDPLGFGLENLNAIGQWREMDGKIPVDSAGAMPNGGPAFHGPKELKAILAKQPAAFVESASEKLFTYALGRGLERYDKPALAAITDKLPAQNYRFQQLVLGIVNSLQFQARHVKEVKSESGLP
jgi:hypothetical protein